jgi:DnaK suppressor protein
MDTYDLSMAPHFHQLLVERAAQLRRILDDESSRAELGGSHEVTDFKDAASDASFAAINEAHATHAAQELEHVLAALRRMADNTYGICLDCGNSIDLRRLAALPATAYCTACQSRHEKARAGGYGYYRA